MAYDPTQPVPPSLEATQWYEDLTPPPPPPLPPPPFDPRTLPYFQRRNRLHWTTVVALGATFLILVSPFIWLLLGSPHVGR